jgi:hypothetical protein
VYTKIDTFAQEHRARHPMSIRRCFQDIDVVTAYKGVAYASATLGAIVGVANPSLFDFDRDEIVKPAIYGGLSGLFLGLASPIVVPTLAITAPLLAYRSMVPRADDASDSGDEIASKTFYFGTQSVPRNLEKNFDGMNKLLDEQGAELKDALDMNDHIQKRIIAALVKRQLVDATDIAYKMNETATKMNSARDTIEKLKSEMKGITSTVSLSTNERSI